jgi:TRAP-type uncharacterized transport system substrate-binding protein
MKLVSALTNQLGLVGYRIKKYPGSAILSFVFTIAVTCIVYYFINKTYPEFKPLDNWLSYIGKKHDAPYTFYSGKPGGTYYAIGNIIQGKFKDDGDSISNDSTSGGYENLMKVTVEGNAFGIMQEELIKKDDELRKNVQVIAPLFLERMHIFYRKKLFRNINSGYPILLSNNIDTSILHCIAHSVTNINVGPVGSGTRIISSYVLAIIDQQIKDNLKTSSKYKLTDESLGNASVKMLTGKNADAPDMMFYIGSDPSDLINKILDSAKYGLLSISPSFVAVMNKEFNLNLRITDFQKKYYKAPISTFGTMAYLIASKSVPIDDVLRMLKRIDTSKARIHKLLFRLPVTAHSDSCYSGLSKNCSYILPLAEFGFFNSFINDYTNSKNFKWKELLAFIISMVAIFFPVLKSATGISSVFKKWSVNKKIDHVVNSVNKKDKDNQTACNELSGLRNEIIDLYGDGRLSESNYKPLLQRVDLYLGLKDSIVAPEGKIKILQRDEEKIIATN